MMVTPSISTSSSGYGAFDVAAGIDGHVDDHTARPSWPQPCHAVTMRGAGRPNTCAVVMTMSDLAMTSLAMPWLLHRQLLRSQLAGIAVLGLAGLTQVDLDKLCAERLHLLGDHRAGVERFDPGTEALGRGDRLQSGNAGTDDEHPWPA